ncbi:MAG: TonB-dependent receptor [Pseudarcicella sp.]|nr:TonB-dependent receptor [Pseudarcicella sp.]
MKNKLFLVPLILLMCASFFSTAQKLAITGKIVDEDYEPLIGVTIKVKNSKDGVVTNENGDFKIYAASNATLIVSYIGFITKEEVVANRSNINIQLSKSEASVEEVVVVAYGTQKKVNLTGSVSTISARDIQNYPVTNMITALQGQVPGLTIIQPSGQPGNDEPTINIRGISTLGNASPLIVIDGFQASTSALSNLSPSEIENVTVLKDAASAAIYGSRSANGVILITTDRSNKGQKIKVDFNNYYGFQQATLLPEFVNSSEWLNLNLDVRGLTDPNSITKNPAIIPTRDRYLQLINSGMYKDSLSNTKWYDQVFRVAPLNNHNLNFRYDHNKLSLQANFGYQNQQGIMKNTSSDRINARLNLKYDLSKKIKTGFNSWMYIKNVNEPYENVNAIMEAIAKAPSLVPVKYSNGNYAVEFEAKGLLGIEDAFLKFKNPLLMTDPLVGTSKTNVESKNLQGFLMYEPIKGLVFSNLLTYSRFDSEKNRIKPTYSFTNLSGVASGLSQNINNLALLDVTTEFSNQWQIQNYVTYNFNLNKKNDFTALAGHETISFKSEEDIIAVSGFNGKDIKLGNEQNSDRLVDKSGQSWFLESYFGRLNYSYNDKYLLEANLRADRSSRFSNTRFKLFPSYSAAWRISEEKFLVNSRTISNLKLRASYGLLGNDKVGDFTTNQYLSTNNKYTSTVDASYLSSKSNPQIAWEKSEAINYGLDVAFLKNKFSMSVDYFNKKTKDILLRLPDAPSSGGLQNPNQNSGEVSNKGWDIEATYKENFKKVNFSFSANISKVTNRVEKLAGQEIVSENGAYITKEGYPINSFFGYKTNGIHLVDSIMKNEPSLINVPNQLGHIRFVDVNKDGVIDANDRTILGNSFPGFSYGFSTRIAYEGFDLSAVFQGVKGNYVYNFENGNRPTGDRAVNFWPKWSTDAVWKPGSLNATLPDVKNDGPQNTEISDFWIDDASYLRLKNIEVGYSFPKTALAKLKLSKLRIYANAQNVLTFTDLENVDPEKFASDIRNASYPQVKTVSLGLNASF